MTYLTKPKFHHPALPKNALGYTHRDYEGSISTLCAGCGRDSISAAIIEACYELAIEPHRVANSLGSAARRRRLLIFSASRTASTPCMDACRRF